MRKHTLIIIGLLALLLAAGLPVLQAQENSGRICVAAYNDANENSMRDPMEPLLANVAVYLQNEEAAVVTNYVTNGATEPHCFEGLAPGNYAVLFTPYNATPTSPESFTATITTGQSMPVQFQFGAVPGEETIIQPAAPATGSGMADLTTATWTTQLVAACCCSSLCMLVFAVLGALIGWMRFRNK